MRPNFDIPPIHAVPIRVNAEYWHVILKYLTPELKIQPEITNSRAKTPNAFVKMRFAQDIPLFEQKWYLTKQHLENMQAIPLRTLIQNGIHSTFSRRAVVDAITCYSQNTYNALYSAHKESTIETACKFASWSEKDGVLVGDPKGALIIPYFARPSESYLEYRKFYDDYAMPNFTVRTNNSKMKYARSATNLYNSVEDKKTLPRMPYIPFSELTPETAAVAEKMMLDDLAEEFAATHGIPVTAAAEQINAASRLVTESINTTDKPALYIIEGEKKALALSSAISAQKERAILNAANGKPFDIPMQASVIGVSGVWQTISRSTELQHDLSACINFKDRDVVIVYDNDMQHNPLITNAIATFAAGLTSAGAHSVSMKMPSVPEKCADHPEHCKGFDDVVISIMRENQPGVPPLKDELRTAQCEALDDLQRNIRPCSTCHMQIREIRDMFAPYLSGKENAQDAISKICADPTPEFSR